MRHEDRKVKKQPQHIESVATVGAPSSAAKAPAKYQCPAVKSLSVLAYGLIKLLVLCACMICQATLPKRSSDTCALTTCHALARSGPEGVLRAGAVRADEDEGTRPQPLCESL